MISDALSRERNVGVDFAGGAGRRLPPPRCDEPQAEEATCDLEPCIPSLDREQEGPPRKNVRARHCVQDLNVKSLCPEIPLLSITRILISNSHLPETPHWNLSTRFTA
jgi:hypothetical protein